MRALLLLALLGLSFGFRSFQDNQKLLAESINLSNSTWKAGVNSVFEGLTFEQVQSMMGLLEDNDEETPFKVFPKFMTQELPEEFDPREEYPECESIKEIRDQSNCGSCWAFGAASALSDRICIASKGEYQTRVSTKDIISCCTECGYGCKGGFNPKVWKYFETTGVVTGNHYDSSNKEYCQNYPFPDCLHGAYTLGDNKERKRCSEYEPFETPECVNKCHQDYSKHYEEDKWFTKNTYRLKTEQDIMTELVTKGPVEAGFTVFEDFGAYKSGVYQHLKGKALGGHSIKIIGYGVEEGVKYWLCVNSWNEQWGDQGLFKILRGTNESGIESRVYAGDVRLP